jgi:Ser/Thr protein kinase RdoA (MazF antagonist)
MTPENLLKLFGLNPAEYKTIAFGSGLINHTWKVCGSKNYILQKINTDVFKQPKAIAQNIDLLDDYLKAIAPGYLFVAPVKTLSGQAMVKSPEAEYYRLFPFIEGSVTLTEINDPQQAFEAAWQFGKFTSLLKDFDPQQLNYTLPDFHNLQLRYDQFTAAVANSPADRLAIAADAIEQIQQHKDILLTYQQLIAQQLLPLRVIHHDTKISNILFDENGKGLCVIDLDTVMPGYFISDVGDMMRTYLSPANEEEKDFSKIQINADCFYAIYKGYSGAMAGTLTDTEKEYFIYAGKFIIYMQALRFLTDFINGDIYYRTTYPQQNLVRAQNQLTLLNRYIGLEGEFKVFIAQQ